MRRNVIALTCMAACGVAFYGYASFGPYSTIWLILGVPVALVTAFCCSLMLLLGSSISDHQTGTVIKHRFTMAHQVSGRWVGDEWSLQLQDEHGNTSWISFSKNVFADYPAGSHYPRVTQPQP